MSEDTPYKHPQRFKILRGGPADLAVLVSDHLNGLPVKSIDGVNRYAYYRLHGPVFLTDAGGAGCMCQSVVWYGISESKEIPIEVLSLSGLVN